MSILAGDLVILASENMNDTDNGGGAATDNVIVDGQSNNMFDDISTLDRTYGAVNLRKVFPAVRTQDNAKFYGSHVNIVKLPGDTQIGVNLFKTGDHFDTRVDAANRIENYRAQGGKYPAYLWGTQYAGAQVITVFQGESAQIPAAGDVLVLVKYPSELQQFIRISNVSSTLQTFTDTQGQFTRRIVVFEISSPLEMDFSGIEITRFDTTTPPTSLYKTTVANAARYYSARPLAVAGEIGDINVTVDTVYSQVVPSSQSQTPLIDLSAGSNAAPLVNSASGTVTVNVQQQLMSLYLGSACQPGSVALTDHYGNAYTDVGGYILDATTTKIGVIDYMSGVISFLSLFYAGAITYTPSVAPLVIADTSSIKITDNNRSFVYTLNIDPPPQPGALSVSYMAMASWYELRDNATGALLGQVAGIGTGSINYTTGSVSVTFAALPDVGSEIIFAWGKKVDYINRAVDSGGAAITGKHVITKQLAHTGIDPSSFDISWYEENAAVTRHITSNSAGVLTGFGTGNLNVSTGLVTFTPSNIIPVGTVFTFAYDYGATGTGAAVVSKTLTSFNMVGNSVELNLGDTNIVSGSLSVEWAVPWGSSVPDGLGELMYAELPVVASGTQQQADRDNAAGGFVGGRSAAVNYTTGIVSFNWAIDLPLQMPLYKKPDPRFLTFDLSSAFLGYVGKNADLANPTAFNVRYRVTSADSLTSTTETLQYNAAVLDLTPGVNDTIVPGSVMFDFGNKRYVDRAGSLYSDINPTTGAGTYAGTIDYGTGICNITGYSLINNVYTFTVLSALSTANFNPVDSVVFRTAVAPIKPSSFSIRAVQLHGGDQVTATANETGVISTTEMFGEINQDTGVVKIRFGQMVTAAGNESQPWYNPDFVVSGQIFKPKPVLASTIIYNAVSFTFIPLDKDILGLDSVRLPVDGRIPVYRKGDVVVVLNDQKHTGTYTSSTTTNLGRVRLAKVTVKDLGGTLLNAAKWSVDLDTGIITWGDLSGVSQPLTITDRIEDMAVVADVQITGKVKLSEPLSHHFPATSTLVSNAVVYGDLFASTSTPFDQQTWYNTWLDVPYGNTVPAEYNHVLHPIIVTNLGTIEQKWAVIFVTSTTFNVVGEHVGQVVTAHSIAVDCQPFNPGNNDPYFTLEAAGWGAGWSAGNVLRFNTYAAKAPLWVVQSIAQGDPTDTDYGFCIELRGDVDSV